MTRQDPGARHPLEWVGLALLAAFTLIAILGYGVFGLHPNLIPDSDSARRFYGLSFQLFARVHILLAAVVLVIPLSRRIGLSWVPALLAVFLASFLSEFIGTGYGVPFGGYAYTGLLGFKLGGRVPAVIPLSWFLMALPSWAMANAMFPGKSQRLGRMLMGGYLLTAWDLALDPAMSYLTPYWIWEESGPFYGMPWVNLVGWMGTGMVLMLLLEAFGSRRWGVRLPLRWLSAYYGVVLFMPLGMIVAAGLWWALLATLVALSLALGFSLALRVREARALEPALAQGQVGS
ncbi:MAG: carotenoid biosynthesis protein [Longimicrobiales bacterium]